MPPIVRYEFTIQSYFAGTIEVHRITWIFYDADGNQYPGTQDRQPANWQDHHDWVAGQAAQFSDVTTDEAL